MTDESLLLDIDIIEKQYENALAKTRSDLAVKEAILDVKNAILDVKNAILAEAYHTITQTNSDHIKSPPAGKLYASRRRVLCYL